MRWAKKTDHNQAEMVEALRKAGRSVVLVNGAIDLAVGYQRQTYLLEVKNPGGRDRPTQTQTNLFLNWKGGPLYVVRSIDEALDLTSGVLLK